MKAQVCLSCKHNKTPNTDPCGSCSQVRIVKDYFELAEPKVLTPNDWIDKQPDGSLPGNSTQSYIDCANEMFQNGRLERDLELKPIISAFEDFFFNCKVHTIKEARDIFKNLPPLDKND